MKRRSSGRKLALFDASVDPPPCHTFEPRLATWNTENQLCDAAPCNLLWLSQKLCQEWQLRPEKGLPWQGLGEGF